MWSKITRFLFLFIIFSSLLHAAETKTCPFLDTCKPNDFLYYLNSETDEVMNQVSPKGRVKKASFALGKAEDCVKRFPEEAGCYLYRAVLQGLYIETTGLGYQKALSKMVKDAREVLKLDASYDQGGAYRILGNIYLKVPGFSLADEGIVKDVDMAFDFAQKAMAVSALNPDNRLLMGEVLVEKGSFKEAGDILGVLLKEYQAKSPKTVHDKEMIRDIGKLLSKILKKS